MPKTTNKKGGKSKTIIYVRNHQTNKEQVIVPRDTKFFSHIYVILSPSMDSSSVLKQKDESQNGCYKKTKHTKFSENECVLGGKCLFFGKFGVLCFLVTSVEFRLFASLSTSFFSIPESEFYLNFALRVVLLSMVIPFVL